MDNVMAVGPAMVERRTTGLRISSVIAALALVFAMFVLVQQRADASPAAGAAVAASVASVGSSVTPQLNFNQIICSVLLSIRSAFTSSPFFAFVAAAINSIIIGFGCSPS